MRLNSRLFVVILAIAVALTGLLMPLAALPAQGQAQDTVTITVAVPNFLKEVFSDKFLGDFQSANPGIKVNVVTSSDHLTGEVLSERGYAVVLEPEELRSSVADRARQLLAELARPGARR